MASSKDTSKGIILVAGAGTGLSPTTFPISKALLPVYDRPMIYCSISTLMSAGIRDILVITSEADRHNFERTLKDGSHLGIRISYEVQHVQRGISDAFIIAEDFIGGDPCVLMLGDNIFHGDGFEALMEEASKDTGNSNVFARWVPDPKRFGIAEFDSEGKVISLEEKPKEPKSNYAVVGLYYLPGDVSSKAKRLTLSARGELEITDLNRMYLEEGRLNVRVFGEDIFWKDAGTFDSLFESADYIRRKEKETGSLVLCPEIVAVKKGYVSKEKMLDWVASNKDNSYFLGIKDYIERM